tara:strand:- start:1261 stop:1725 length:465 start_codon:yes stop_codon:yes gene_type:complete
MRFSKNFYLSEFTKSATSQRLNLENSPNKEQLINLQFLIDNVLQVVRDKIGAIRITSGFRSPELCLALGSKKTSQHTKGQASDIQFHRDGYMNNKLLMDTIIEHCEFDQLINEYDFSWIHVSYNCDNNRNQILKAYKEEGKTRYMDITHQFKSL